MVMPLPQEHAVGETIFKDLLRSFLTDGMGSMRIQAVIPRKPYVDVHRFGGDFVLVLAPDLLSRSQTRQFRHILGTYGKKMVVLSVPGEEGGTLAYHVSFRNGSFDRERFDDIVGYLFRDLFQVKLGDMFEVFSWGALGQAELP